ncbi:HNH endonuclease [Streptomyces phage Moab]|nr:HNH endonuclease [Streptomyces phage Moab]WMI33828.1 HNH endonuclease [Streptomyces phage Patelgo]
MSKATYPLSRLMKRDNGICWLCRKLVHRDYATRDHVIPYSHGGPNHEANLKLAHRKCNEKRENQTLISKSEELKILLRVQSHICFRCLSPLHSEDAMVSRGCPRGSLREIKTAICKSECEKKFSIPFQQRRKMNDTRIAKRIESKKNRIPMEMVVADSLSADQLEIGDYVRFYAEHGLRFGIVRDVTDNDEFFMVTLEDDIEGDVEEYAVDPDTVFSLLVHEAVSV